MGELWEIYYYKSNDENNVDKNIPFELMKFLARLLWSKSFWGGIPNNSIIHDNWSASSSPGSKG